MTSRSKTGSCQCGSVQYTLSDESLMTYACHCRDCQKRTGSAFSMGAICLRSSLSLTGELVSWQRESDDGNINTRHSCEQCGNIIYGDSSDSPEFIKLQPGTLDDSSGVNVDAHIWLCRKQPWLNLESHSSPAALQYETQPEQLIEIFQAVLARKDNH